VFRSGAGRISCGGRTNRMRGPDESHARAGRIACGSRNNRVRGPEQSRAGAGRITCGSLKNRVQGPEKIMCGGRKKHAQGPDEICVVAGTITGGARPYRRGCLVHASTRWPLLLPPSPSSLLKRSSRNVQVLGFRFPGTFALSGFLEALRGPLALRGLLKGDFCRRGGFERRTGLSLARDTAWM
jgi:hypothetical protein